MHVNEFSLLTTKRFFPLLVTQFTSSLNGHLLRAVVLLCTMHRFFTCDSMLALGTACFLIPFLMFSRHAGIIADTSEKSRHIRYIKFYEFIISCVIALAATANTPWILLIAIFAMGVNVAYFLPYKHSILPELVSSDELISGNAFMNTMLFFSALLAMYMYIFLGVTGLTIAMITVSIVGVIGSFFIPDGKALSNDKYSYNLFEQEPVILLCIICISWFWFFAFIYLKCFASFAVLVIQKQYITLELVAALVLGTTIGSLAVNWIQRSEIRLSYVPLALIGLIVFSGDLYLSSKAMSMPLILIDLFLIGISAGIFIVPLYATLQRRSVFIYRARNIASSSILNAKMIVVAYLLLLLMKYNHVAILDILLIVPITGVLLLVFIITKRT